MPRFTFPGDQGFSNSKENRAMTKTLTLTASMMILLAISGHASRARYLPVATGAAQTSSFKGIRT
jgi:hypothetical protein